MASPFISICIPAYKAERFLAETLSSIAAQTFADWEVIVTEDGSHDRTESIVQAFAGRVKQPVIYNRHDSNRGLPTARNTGISAARGVWIAFIDSDDLWTPDHLDTLIAASRREECDMVFAGTRPFDDVTGRTLQPCVPTNEDLANLPLALFTGRLSILPSSTMVRRSAFERYGPVATEFAHANDTEYWLRILYRGGRAVYTGTSTCLYRKHAGAMSLRAARILTNTAQICERYANWPAIPKSVARRRSGNLYRYAGRSSFESDPKAALALIIHSARVDPLRVPTWIYLFVAYLKVAKHRLHRQQLQSGTASARDLRSAEVRPTETALNSRPTV